LGLDFGSGTGPVITKQLLEKGYHVNLYDPYFAPFDDYLQHKYDYIFSCEVFEHFYNPQFEIKRLVNLLKPQGHLLIMTHVFNHQKPFNDWYYKNDPTHVFIYTPKTFDYIAKNFGLKALEIGERFVAMELL
jgi:SAM-dependent methyltransferase